MKHIALIGIDGAGKTSLAERLHDYINSLYKDKVIIARSDKLNSDVLKEMERQGDYKVSDELRLTAYAFDLSIKYMQIANRSELNFVIWDRYFYCLYAYFAALNVDLSQARKITSIMPTPDYTIFLDIDVATAIKRIIHRNEMQKKDENNDYLMKVREEYKKIASDSRIIAVNAALSEEEILSTVLKYIFKK